MASASQRKIIVMDTSAFFAPAQSLRDLLVESQASSASFVTLDLMIFEFLKVVEEEIAMARGKNNLRRLKVLQSLRERFTRLLDDLGIVVKVGEDFALADIEQACSSISKGHESGDSMIWIKMQKLGLDTILTEDLKHWKNLGAKVLRIPRSKSS